MCAFVAVYYQCLHGKLCRSSTKCLSTSQLCDGYRHCPDGEDESHCCKNFTIHALIHKYIVYLLSYVTPVTSIAAEWYCSLCIAVRLYGTNFILQSYSPDHDTWLPVCAEKWDHDYGRTTCELLGYRRCGLYFFFFFQTSFT